MKAKIIIFLFLTPLFFTWVPLARAQSLACASYFGHKYYKKLRINPRVDKFKHCTLSCILAKNCGPGISLIFGIGKEAWDALGFGDPDIEDIRADIVGIKIGTKLFGHRDSDCFQACVPPYPQVCVRGKCE